MKIYSIFRVLVYIIPAVLIAVLVSLPRFVEVETVNLCIDLRNCSSSCEFYTEYVYNNNIQYLANNNNIQYLAKKTRKIF